MQRLTRGLQAVRTQPLAALAALAVLACFFLLVDVPTIFINSLSLRRRGLYHHPAVAARRVSSPSHVATLLQSWLRGCTLDAFGEPTAACCLSEDNLGGRAFPELCTTPIDVVYTWVNGSDPVWLADMLKWRALEGPPDEEPSPAPVNASNNSTSGSSSSGCRPRVADTGAGGNATVTNSTAAATAGGNATAAAASLPFCDELAGTNATASTDGGPSTSGIASVNRYRDNDELRYSFRSVEKYAPWVRRIYLVTNGQVPAWLDVTHPRLRVVTHEQMFPPEAASHLPVFSSPAIEVHLHRIPGLSPSFIYLNDDVLFGSDVVPEDFISRTGGQKVYMSWEVPKCAPGCVDNWLGDGWCDAACNTTRCMWDGGDCLNATAIARGSSYRGSAGRFSGAAGAGTGGKDGAGSPRPPGYTETAEAVLGPFPATGSTAVGALTSTPPCNGGCPDTWIGDKMCDTKCDCADCGWDGGDCGWWKVVGTADAAGGGAALAGFNLPTPAPAAAAAAASSPALSPAAAALMATLQSGWREALTATAGAACDGGTAAGGATNATGAAAAAALASAALACQAMEGNLTAAVAGGFTTGPIATDALQRALWQGGAGQLTTAPVRVPVEPATVPPGLAQAPPPPLTVAWSFERRAAVTAASRYKLWVGGVVPAAAVAPNATVPVGNLVSAAQILSGCTGGESSGPASADRSPAPPFFYVNASSWLGEGEAARSLLATLLAREAAAAAVAPCVVGVLGQQPTANATAAGSANSGAPSDLWACIAAAMTPAGDAAAAAVAPASPPARVAAAEQSGGVFPGGYTHIFGPAAAPAAVATAAAAGFAAALSPPASHSSVWPEVAEAAALSAGRWVAGGGGLPGGLSVPPTLPALRPAYALLRPAAGGDGVLGAREAVRPIRGRAGLPQTALAASASADDNTVAIPLYGDGSPGAGAAAASRLAALLGNATFGGTVVPEYVRTSSPYLAVRDAFVGLLRPAMSARHHAVIDVQLGLTLEGHARDEAVAAAVAALRAAFLPGRNASAGNSSEALSQPAEAGSEEELGLDADPVTALLKPHLVPLTALAFPPVHATVEHHDAALPGAACRLPVGGTALWLKLTPEPTDVYAWTHSGGKQLEVTVPILYTACPALHLRITPILHLTSASASGSASGGASGSGSADGKRRLQAVPEEPTGAPSSGISPARAPLPRLPVALSGEAELAEEAAAPAAPRRLQQQQQQQQQQQRTAVPANAVSASQRVGFISPVASAWEAAARALQRAGVAVEGDAEQHATEGLPARRLSLASPSPDVSALQAAVSAAWTDLVAAAAAEAADAAAAEAAQAEAPPTASTVLRHQGRAARRLGSSDTYADSLVFTNHMLTRRFGRRSRKVPAHMPHFIRRDVMARLQATFPEQFAATSAHRFRSSQDVQYALAYFYFIIEGGARSGLDLNVYWRRELDTDGDGVLSANEFRTLVMVAFKRAPTEALVGTLRGCFSGPITSGSPSDGWAIGGLTFQDLLGCEPIKEGLSKNARFGPTHTDGAFDEVAFEMVGDDRNKTQGQLDSVRGRKAKFICINDDMKEAPPAVTEALASFYKSIVPLPSSFELPAGETNPHLYIEPLRRHRSLQRALALAVVVFPVVAAAAVLATFLYTRYGDTVLTALGDALFPPPGDDGEGSADGKGGAAAQGQGGDTRAAVSPSPPPRPARRATSASARKKTHHD